MSAIIKSDPDDISDFPSSSRVQSYISDRRKFISDDMKKILLICSGVFSIILGIIVPFLPVHVSEEVISWPQQHTTNSPNASVLAPLVLATPTFFTIDLSDAVFSSSTLNKRTLTRPIILSTVPVRSKLARLGLFVILINNKITVSSRGTVILSAPQKIFFDGAKHILRIYNDNDTIHALITKTSFTSERYASEHSLYVGPELKPQIDGLFTDLNNTQLADSHISIHIDNRFSLTPTIFKRLSVVFAILSTVICLTLAHNLHIGKTSRSITLITKVNNIFRHTQVSNHNNYKHAILDCIVIIFLTIWQYLGPAGPGDGIAVTQAANALSAGYNGEYYRFFGITQAPFDWYPNLLSAINSIVDPPTGSYYALLLVPLSAAIISWLLLSRKVFPLWIPLQENFLAYLASAAIFLGLWFPLDTGLRTESIIALLTLLTWIFINKAITESTIIPINYALITAGLSIFSGINGITVLAVLFTYAVPISRLITTHISAQQRIISSAMLVIPAFSAMSAVWVIVFRTQTAANIAETIRVKLNIGPITSWTQEYLRYFYILYSPIAIKMPMIFFAICTAGAFFLSAHALRLTGSNSHFQATTTKKITTIIFLSTLFLFITPNKWPIEMGVLTNFAAMAVLLFIVHLSTNKQLSIKNHSLRNFFLLYAIISLALGFGLSSMNTWPNLYRLGIVWNNIKPQILGIRFVSGFFDLSIFFGILALLLHYVAVLQKSDSKKNFRTQLPGAHNIILQLPLVIILCFIVALDVGGFVKAAINRSYTYTTTKGNFDAIVHNGCNLADHVLVEQDPMADILTPSENISYSDALAGNSNIGFTAKGIPLQVIDKPHMIEASHPYRAYSPQDSYPGSRQYPGMQGGLDSPGINGSQVLLPFGLNNKIVPALGSYGYHRIAQLTTSWYKLPPYSADRPILAIAAIGAIQSKDRYNISQYGQLLTLEFAHKTGTKITHNITVTPIDSGRTHSWRDIRFPLSQIRGANVVRIHILDANLAPDQWIGITPPRIPHLQTLSSIIGKSTSVFKDLAIATLFPCQQSPHFNHGIWQIPTWRIAANIIEMNASTQTWSNSQDGGPFAMIDALTSQLTLPSYLSGDLYEDWGAIIRLTLINSAPLAHIEQKTHMHWGWYRTGPILTFGGNDASKDN